MTVVITGGGRGIGAATAVALARRGEDVCVSYRERADAAEAVVAACVAAGGRALAVQADVSREADVLGLFEAVDARLPPLTGLVNNAGIVAPRSRVAGLSAERVEAMLGVNVLGVFLCAREAVRRMSTNAKDSASGPLGGRADRVHGAGGGCIVNVSSRAATLGSPGEYVDYAASKAAVDTLTVGLAREVAGDGIRVNAVRPGLIDTEIHASGGQPNRIAEFRASIPMGRAGTAEEVAAAIVWLLSPEASYVTGALLDVGGGR